MSDQLNDPLDELLARARWPAASRESTRRLAERWECIRRPRRLGLWRVAAAAVVMLAFATAALVMRKQAPVNVVATSAAAPKMELPGRAPTQRELLLLRMTALATGAAARPVGPPGRVRTGTDEDVLGRRIESGDLVDYELAERFCKCATARSLPLVLKLARDPKLRAATANALDRLADAPTLATLAREWDASGERRKLITALLNRRSQQSLSLYLDLVTQKQTCGDALAAIEHVDQPPVDELLMALQGPRADLHLAAAWALGRIDGPDVTRRLIQMIDDDQNRREAFLALAASRSSEAREYLRQAAASRRFSSLARSAIAQTNTVQPNFRSQS
jgi:hypothetical protein